MIKGRRCIPTRLSLRLSAGAALLTIGLSGQVFALSELKPVQPASDEVEQGPSLPPLEEPTTGIDGGLPQPGPIIRELPQPQTGEITGSDTTAERSNGCRHHHRSATAA
ncbi:hypothetical protein OEG86_19410 [Hoeflea alexandrii]|uniref:hypothetical protein n=1 Tax=Hoeflea alexandrii TaxID=288436 RepID=UPI00226F0956|nr:hypothetical protein [Hoeflea alexandrii]MCY0154040.1 hypothetical protein [Hoeflea alexandrii]